MKFFRSHWYDIGPGLAAIVIIGVLILRPRGLSLILWISLVSLFVHQFEEYRFPGTFPGMMNRAMFASSDPDRYPLNANTSLIVNVAVGWGSYLAAALFGQQVIWLAIAATLVSVGNVLAHTILFNIRGKSWYNAGMFTAIVLFVPIASIFFYTVIAERVATAVDWVVGLVLGAALNYFGVLKLIDLLKNRDTPYVFPQRCVRSVAG